MVTIVKVDRVTKVPHGPQSSRPATITCTEAPPGNADTEAVTDDDTTVPMPRAAGSIQGDEKEFVIKKLVGQCRVKTSMQYHVRWYGYDRSEDT